MRNLNAITVAVSSVLAGAAFVGLGMLDAAIAQGGPAANITWSNGSSGSNGKYESGGQGLSEKPPFSAVNPGQQPMKDRSLSSGISGESWVDQALGDSGGDLLQGDQPTFRDTIPSDRSLQGPSPSDRSMEQPTLESGGTLRSESDFGG
jgi:hypothetical protein